MVAVSHYRAWVGISLKEKPGFDWERLRSGGGAAVDCLDGRPERCGIAANAGVLGAEKGVGTSVGWRCLGAVVRCKRLLLSRIG